MDKINKVAVIGSGVMGSGIAAQIANSRNHVLLFDIADHNSSNKNLIVENAVSKISNGDSLMHPDYIKYIKVCNLEDNLDDLSEVDWVVEAIVEKLEIKHDLYNKIKNYLSPDTIISSNTSTIPLKKLTEIFDEDFKSRFMITHFFNPVRHMKLLELVVNDNVNKSAIERISKFCDKNLGKTVVKCNDTPGFIANRIGCFFLDLGISEAINLKIAPNLADHIMKAFGIPKTGVFGLMDLIGIDIMELISSSLIENLPDDDYFNKAYKKHPLIENMIKNNQLGRKSGAGFYKLNKIGDKKIMQILDLDSKEYENESENDLSSIIYLKSPYDVINSDDPASKYAKNVIWQLLYYTCTLIPSVSDNIFDVDLAMKLGFKWKYGPFEMIDILGREFLIEKIKLNKLEVPEILKISDSKKFYDEQNDRRFYLGIDSKYHEIKLNYVSLANIKKHPKNLIYKNEEAQLLDMGDGVACFELNSKMNSLNIKVFEAFSEAINIVEKTYKAMIIGSDSDNFSVGGDLKYFLSLMNSKKYEEVADFIRLGQKTMMKIKYAKFPIIAAVCGYALGGGTELLLHCYKVQAHVESYIGLVESSIGVLPGWGGTKQLIMNYYQKNKQEDIIMAFETLMKAEISKSAQKACDTLLLHDKMHFSMNRDSLLCDAKALALTSLINFKEQEKKNYKKVNFIPDFSKYSEHQQYIAKHIYNVFMVDEITEENLLNAEVQNFVQLSKTDYAIEKISSKL